MSFDASRAPERFSFSNGTRWSTGFGTVLLLGLLGLLLFQQHEKPAGGAAEAVAWAVAGVLALLIGYLLAVLTRLWNRIEVSPVGLRSVSPWRGTTELAWPRVASIEFRLIRKRFDVCSRDGRTTIRVEVQLRRVDELLTLVADRVPDLPATPRATEVPVGPDGVVIDGATVPLGQIAQIRVVSVAPNRIEGLVVGVQLASGEWLAVHSGPRGLLETYQRLHKAWKREVERAAIELPPAVPGAGPPRPSTWKPLAFRFAVLLLFFVGSVLIRRPDIVPWLHAGSSDRVAVTRANALFRAAHYEEVAELAEHHYASHDVTPENLPLLVRQAISYRRLGRSEAAIAAFEAGLPALRSLDEVSAEPYGQMLYDLAQLYDDVGSSEQAAEVLREGLRLRPSSSMHRALLASLDESLAEMDLARAEFLEIIESAPSGSEARVVAERRLARLDGKPWPAAATAPEPQLTRAVQLAIIPVEPLDARLDLDELCLVLEEMLWLPCRVMPAQVVPDEKFRDEERNQFRAEKILGVLVETRRRFQSDVVQLAVVSRDMFSDDNNFVFSSARYQERIAVLSTYRLLESLPSYWPADALAGRRVAIQAISAVAGALGLARPTGAQCPTAYPNGLESFLLKRAELCASTIRSRDALLERLGGERIQQDSVRQAATRRALRHYLID